MSVRALAGVVVLCAGTVWAQVPSVGLGTTLVAPPPAPPMISGGFGGIVGGVSGLTCKHQPYSLVYTLTTVKTLADGTHITHVQKTRKTQDSECRTRTEMGYEFDGKPVDTFVTISDPVAREYVVLTPRQMEVRVTHWPEPKKATPEEEARTAEMRAEFAKKRAEAAAAGTPKVVTAGDSRMEQLGQRNIDGVLTEGTRSSHVTPAGTRGNDREMVSTLERWTSPDLGVDMLRVDDSPEYGKTTTVVSDLKRAEPDAALFRVPEGYKVVGKQ